MAEQKAEIGIGGESYEYAVRPGTVGPSVIDAAYPTP